jgi:SAM-dependent methyltransferase
VAGTEPQHNPWTATDPPGSVGRVTTNAYDDPRVARTYDAENDGRWDVDFYRALTQDLSQGVNGFAVLDIGCGTGALGAELAGDGYQVTGVDPSAAMLGVARTRPGADRVTWILGHADSAPEAIADLVVMTGHVAQYFLTVEAWAEVLHHAHRALRPGGRIAFESRNPGVRAWESWTRENTIGTYPHPDGGAFTSWGELLAVDEAAPEGVLETHRGITVYPDGSRSGDDTSETLVFRSLDRLTSSLETAGFHVEQVYGDWSRGPVTGTSREFILIGRRD